MTRKDYELRLGTVMFPAITKDDLEEVMNGRTLSEFIEDPQIHISVTQREAVKILLEFYDEQQKETPQSGSTFVEMEPVASSNVKAIAYKEVDESLFIKFHSGAVYQYHGVTATEYRDIRSSESIGKAINAFKQNHSATKVA